ncbi:MAG: hypothetical protein WBC05_08755 [Sedimentisphaerales bacterium]
MNADFSKAELDRIEKSVKRGVPLGDTNWTQTTARRLKLLLNIEAERKTQKMYPLWGRRTPYELSGLTPNVVFPTGLLLRGDELWMYYGAADNCTCLATAKLDEVLALLVD